MPSPRPNNDAPNTLGGPVIDVPLLTKGPDPRRSTPKRLGPAPELSVPVKALAAPYDLPGF